MLFSQYIRTPIMPISAMPERAAEFRCRSAADPVPAPQNASDFRCPLAQPNHIQGVDTKEVFDANGAIFENKTHFFAADRELWRVRHRRGQADEADGSGLPEINCRPASNRA
jgi:hypothetical protein